MWRAAASGWRWPSGWWKSQGGELGVASELGVGTTFWMDLPVAAAPLADAEPNAAGRNFSGTCCFRPTRTNRGAVKGPPNHRRPPRTMLHIEDNEPNRRLVEMLILQRPAVRLLTAARGLEGLALAREHQPDLILLDMHLPDTADGFVLRELRSAEGTRRTPVVMVSADAAADAPQPGGGHGGGRLSDEAVQREPVFQDTGSISRACRRWVQAR